MISVIIPTYDEPGIGAAIASVFAQAGADAIGELIVVGRDSGHWVPAHPRVRFIENLHARTPGVNRNLGLAAAQGDPVLFLDADCVAQAGWLAGLCAALTRTPVVSGVVALTGDAFWATAYNVSTFHEFRVGLPAGPRAYLPSLTLAATRAACAAVGPFDEDLPRSEDLDWTIRLAQAGYALALAPAAVVAHHPRGGWAGVWRKWADTGYYSALVRRRYPQVAYASHLAGLLARPGLLRVLAPAVALAVTARIFRAPALWRFAYTAPVVWATKVAWCWGAARFVAGGGET